MQFKTEIRAAVPRSKCAECGIKTIAIPWAGKHSRFTWMFEAVAIKENFRHFWKYVYAFSAEGFFDHWYSRAIRSRLEPIKKVARMLKKHLDGMLSYSRHRITNAITEGFNSRIQSIKSAARGFRNFANYRLRVLFYCGKLEMTPEGCH